jgi:CPA2 family monovalent cation:H+ antiporter-2
VELQGVLAGGETRLSGTSAPWLKPHEEWNLNVVECVLPDLADVQGRRIAELDLRSKFGCTIVGIERQGYMIPLPTPDMVLYPRDKVLLMGTAEQVQAGKRFLAAVSGTPPAASEFDEVGMEAVIVPDAGPALGHSLKDLGLARRHRVQVAGIRRGGYRLLNPGADETLQPADELLVLGTPAQIAEFKDWLREGQE